MRLQPTFGSVQVVNVNFNDREAFDNNLQQQIKDVITNKDSYGRSDEFYRLHLAESISKTLTSQLTKDNEAESPNQFARWIDYEKGQLLYIVDDGEHVISDEIGDASAYNQLSQRGNISAYNKLRDKVFGQFKTIAETQPERDITLLEGKFEADDGRPFTLNIQG